YGSRRAPRSALLTMRAVRDNDQRHSRYRQPHGWSRQESAEHADHRRRLAAGVRRRNPVSGRRKRIGKIGHLADGDGTAAKGFAGAARRQHQACRRAIARRQRIRIAMALVLEPKLLIADEPTTALDVTTQKQILTLIRDLQRDHGTAVLFITHDMGVVAEIADRVAVMRHGRLVETGALDSILRAPTMEYTRTLLSAVPSLIPRRSEERR